MGWLFTPLGRVVLLAALLVPFRLVYLLAQQRPSGLNVLVFAFAMQIGIVCWMIDDARRLKRTPCFDFGFLALIAWPLSMFGYCVWTRGWRGVPLSLGLFSLAYAPAVLAGLAWVGLFVGWRLIWP
jgi:hypothetical protein